MGTCYSQQSLSFHLPLPLPKPLSRPSRLSQPSPLQMLQQKHIIRQMQSQWHMPQQHMLQQHMQQIMRYNRQLSHHQICEQSQKAEVQNFQLLRLLQKQKQLKNLNQVQLSYSPSQNKQKMKQQSVYSKQATNSLNMDMQSNNKIYKQQIAQISQKQQQFRMFKLNYKYNTDNFQIEQQKNRFNNWLSFGDTLGNSQIFTFNVLIDKKIIQILFNSYEQTFDSIRKNHNKRQTIKIAYFQEIQTNNKLVTEQILMYKLLIQSVHTPIFRIVPKNSIRMVQNLNYSKQQQNPKQFKITVYQKEKKQYTQLIFAQNPTILQIKQKISLIKQIDIQTIFLTYNDHQMDNDQQKLSQLGSLSNHATLILIVIKPVFNFTVYDLKYNTQFFMNSHSTQTIGKIRQQIKKQIQQNQEIFFIVNFEILKDTQLVQQILGNSAFKRIFMIYKKQIVQTQISELKLKKLINQNVISIKITENECVYLSYALFKDTAVHLLISLLMIDSKPSYCLLYKKVILRPLDKLKQMYKFIEANQKDIQLLLVRSFNKISFMSEIDTTNTFDISTISINQSQQSLIKDQSTISSIIKELPIMLDARQKEQIQPQTIYQPIQCYTCNLTSNYLNSFLWQLNIYDHTKIKESKYYNMCSCLTRSLSKLYNYIGTVHRGISQKYLSTYLKIGDFYYWQNFVSTSKDQKVAMNFMQRKGTLCHIESLTGKQIQLFSIFPEQKEVLLLPFTYFYVSNIKTHQKYDQIWLIQVPSPLSFSKDLAIWVDDKPMNNGYLINGVDTNYQVLQLTSTKIAQLWLKQFYWIIEWKNLKLKGVTNMVRTQKWIQNQVQVQKVNYLAGIDLVKIIKQIYDKSQILFFCSDVNKAIQNMKQANVKDDQIKITSEEQQVIKFLNKK